MMYFRIQLRHLNNLNKVDNFNTYLSNFNHPNKVGRFYTYSKHFTHDLIKKRNKYKRHLSSTSALQNESYSDSISNDGIHNNDIKINIKPQNVQKHAANERMSNCLRKLREAYPTVVCKIEDSTAYVRSIETLSACGINYSTMNFNEALNYQESDNSIYIAIEIGHFQPTIINELIRAKASTNSSNSCIVVDITLANDVEFSYLRLKEMLEPIQPRLIKLKSQDIHNNKLYSENLQSYKDWLDIEAPLLCQLAFELNSLICVTGPIDMVINDCGTLISKISFDTKLLNRIPGTSNAIGALSASALSVLPDQSFMAVTTACSVYKFAAREALKDSKGPGSLAINLLDQLYRTLLSPDKLSDELVVFTDIEEIQQNLNSEGSMY